MAVSRAVTEKFTVVEVGLVGRIGYSGAVGYLLFGVWGDPN